MQNENMNVLTADEEAEFLSLINQLTQQKRSLLSFAVKAIADGEDADKVLGALLAA